MEQFTIEDILGCQASFEKNGVKYFPQVTISPHKAQLLLQRNENNRKLNKSYTQQFTSVINLDEWRYDASPIVFTNNGHLADGQHRLTGCAYANYSIISDVVTNVPDEAFKTMDTNKVRSLADIMGIEGITNANKIAAIVANFCYLNRGYTFTSDLSRNSAGRHSVHDKYSDTKSEMLETYKKYSDLFQEMNQLANKCVGKVRLLSTSAIGGYASYLIISCGYSIQKVSSFFRELFQLESVTNSTITVLYDKLLSCLVSKYKMTSIQRDAIIVKTFNAYIKGREMKVLSYNPDKEERPRFIKNESRGGFISKKDNIHNSVI